jgi:4-amino-4-deoxy-L-arabinose transferase-like glycosyltransferase
MFRLRSVPRSLILVIGLSLALRLICAVLFPMKLADDTGSYFLKGAEVVSNTIRWNDPINFGPVYALLLGAGKLLIGEQSTLVIVRLLQVILGTATCGLVWRIAHRLTGNTRIATVAGLGLALNPIFIIENMSFVSETVFVFLLVWAVALYIALYTQPQTGAPPRFGLALVAIGGLLGLATLTRAMLLLFPIGLAIHLLLLFRWRQALRGAGVLLVIYVAVVSTWTLYNAVKFNRFVVGASGMADFLMMGVVGYGGPWEVDKQIAASNDGQMPKDDKRNSVIAKAVGTAVLSNPLGYLGGRFGQLGSALLQPHNTPYFPGESLKDLAARWWAEDRSVAGLGRLFGGEAFWPKLALYAAHFLAIIFGAVGIVLTWRRRQIIAFAPLLGLIAYTLLLHLFLLATPRYLFPLFIALWIFAAVGMVWTWEWIARRFVSVPILRRSAAVKVSR